MNRRTLLTGSLATAGAWILPRITNNLRAEAAGIIPKRFVVVQTSNGLQREFYRQAGLPAAKDIKAPVAAPLVLREIFAPFADWKDRLLIVEGLHNPFDHELHGNVFASLCVRRSTTEGRPGGISIDRFAAQTLGRGSPRSSIALATVYHRDDNIARASDGPGAVFPAEPWPEKAFAKYFAGFSATPDAGAELAARKLRESRKSLLDHMQSDINRFKTRLPSDLQPKMDQYLASLRDVETRVTAAGVTAGGGCMPKAPAVTSPEAPRSYSPTDQFIEAHLDLAYMALACGITNVANIAFGTSDGKISHFSYQSTPYRESYHRYCHGGDIADPDKAVQANHLYESEKIASFCRRLANTKEGDGTMLDNTVVLMVNDGGGKHHNGYNDIPIVVLGAKGGGLKTGQIVSYPLMTRSTADAFVAVLQAMGIEAKTFGDPAANRGPLQEIL